VKKILLIHPSLERSFFSDIKLPPVGLAYIAAVLRRANHEVRIFDAILSRDQTQDIREILRTFRPDVVGIGMTSGLVRISLQIAKMAKGLDPATAVVMGGVHPTLFPREIMENANVDYVVSGEGEISMLELVRCLEQGLEPEGVPGVVFRKDGGIVCNPPRPLIENLDDLPIPAYDLLPIHHYTSLQIAAIPFISMITSRGCPFECVFCSARLLMGKRYRAQTPEKTVMEMQWLIDRFHAREILFKDSEFTTDLRRVEEICELLLKKGVKIKWSCNGRVGRVSRELMRKMKRAGCRLIEFGIESGDEAILGALNKQIHTDEVRTTFALARESGVKTIANFMLGNPGETRASIAASIHLAKEIRPDYCDISFLTAFPGTALYDMARLNGWLLPNYDPTDIRLDQCTMNATRMSDKELEGMFKKAYRSFYLRPGYILGRMLHLNAFEWKMNLVGMMRVLGIR
jgi:anaerobic magnesium-protoporphyrin IX monomethyl ester cyclase